ncbi:MAG: glycogen synthase GlgA [Spirochaetia bacterium]|nr:glycogen synthase GlgA [Spirochaetia bacterium]
MKICMIASEAVPFAKTGGLADIVTSLSKKLSLLGHDVRVVIPRYASISTEKLTPSEATISVPIRFTQEKCEVLQGHFPNSEVPVYFIEHPAFSTRAGYYGGNGSHTYRDNNYRFALLSRAVFPLCRSINWIPDIFHSHDWQTAIVNAYLREFESESEFQHSRGIFTIHNIGYQGIFSKHDLHTTQLSWETCSQEIPQVETALNYMKCGILNADAITTVSPTYAKEIQTEEFAHGMEQLLRERSASLYGILNGVDYDEWDPKHDPHLPQSYSADDLTGKAAAKAHLQKKVGLPVDAEVPLIGLVSRLAAQKGFYELCDPHRGALKRICQEMSVQVVVLGTGEEWLEEELLNLQRRLPNLKVKTTFSDSLAHQIEAGSDFFLMPSRYEPCGLNQIYSLRYGTLPIVRATGGLADTVENYNHETGQGTGFMFNDLSPESIFRTTEWAISIWYEKPEQFRQMQIRAMNSHFSWKDSADHYVKLYQRFLDA